MRVSLTNGVWSEKRMWSFLYIRICMHMHLLSTTLFYNCPASGAHVCVGQQLYFLLFHKARAKVCRSPLVTHARFMQTWDTEKEMCFCRSGPICGWNLSQLRENPSAPPKVGGANRLTFCHIQSQDEEIGDTKRAWEPFQESKTDKKTQQLNKKLS